MQSEVNIKVGNKPPKEYFGIIRQQMDENERLVSGISTEQELYGNLQINCIPPEIMEMGIDDYQGFLIVRRKLMAERIKKYYHSL